MEGPQLSENFSPSDKSETLQTLYKQVQSTFLTLRDWLAKLFTGVIGFLLIIDGWVVTSSSKMTNNQRIAIVCGVLLISAIAVYAVKQIHKEILAVSKLIVSVEKALGVYTEGAYIKGATLYPTDYMRLGNEDYEHGRHIFYGPFLMIMVFTLFSIALVLLI